MTGSRTDKPFLAAIASLAGIYLLLIVLMILAMSLYGFGAVSGEKLIEILASDAVAFSIRLTLFSCTVSAILSVKLFAFMFSLVVIVFLLPHGVNLCFDIMTISTMRCRFVDT